jgi:hypothetical protein
VAAKEGKDIGASRLRRYPRVKLLDDDKLGERRFLCGFGVLCEVGSAESLSEDVCLDEDVA